MIPQRVDWSGKPYQEPADHDRHPRRTRRSAHTGSNDTIIEEEENRGGGGTDEGNVAYYKVQTFGQELHFRLQPSEDFISPSLVVEYIGRNESRVEEYDAASEEPATRGHGSKHSCFHTGGILGDPDSTAVFNLCHSMVRIN